MSDDVCIGSLTALLLCVVLFAAAPALAQGVTAQVSGVVVRRARRRGSRRDGHHHECRYELAS